MRPSTYTKVRGHLASLHPLLGQVSREGLRIALTVVATVLWLMWFLLLGIGNMASELAKFIRRAYRVTRDGVVFLRWNILQTLRTLREKEKALEPRAVQALHVVEEVVVETAVKTAPQARKMAWNIGRIFFVIWILGTLGGIAALLFVAG